jgi:hypothetical protein
VIVDNFDVIGVAVSPRKTDSPLIVDSDAVLAATVPAQFLQPVARRDPEILEPNGSVHVAQLTQHDAPQVRRIPTDRFALPQALGIAVRKASNHLP